MVEVLNAAADGKIKSLYIMGDTDQLHVEERLKKLVFLVVQDIFLTDTAKLVDVVLPAACFAEKNGILQGQVRSWPRTLRCHRVDSAGGTCRLGLAVSAEYRMSLGHCDTGTMTRRSIGLNERYPECLIIAALDAVAKIRDLKVCAVEVGEGCLGLALCSWNAAEYCFV